MPSLGADMAAGTLVAWHAEVGDYVRRGDVVAAVETDKGLIEVEIFTEGVLCELLVSPGTKVPVGTPLARVATTAPHAADAVSVSDAVPDADAVSVSDAVPDADADAVSVSSPDADAVSVSDAVTVSSAEADAVSVSDGVSDGGRAPPRILQR